MWVNAGRGIKCCLARVALFQRLALALLDAHHLLPDDLSIRTGELDVNRCRSTRTAAFVFLAR